MAQKKFENLSVSVNFSIFPSLVSVFRVANTLNIYVGGALRRNGVSRLAQQALVGWYTPSLASITCNHLAQKKKMNALPIGRYSEE